jgi:DNA-binding transcriptional MerR regulator
MDHTRFRVADKLFVVRHPNFGNPIANLGNFHPKRFGMGDQLDELAGNCGLVGGHGRLLCPSYEFPVRLPQAMISPAQRHASGGCHRCTCSIGYAAREREMTDIRLSFKEMCAKFDVTPRTLRYYEYIELLAPEREGRSRFYGSREIARMTLIRRGRKFGFQLEEIRQWLLIYEHEGTEAQMQAWIDMADRQMAELKEQQVQLAEAITELQALRDETAAKLAG